MFVSSGSGSAWRLMRIQDPNYDVCGSTSLILFNKQQMRNSYFSPTSMKSWIFFAADSDRGSSKIWSQSSTKSSQTSNFPLWSASESLFSSSSTLEKNKKFINTAKFKTSVVDPNILKLDPVPGFWPNLDSDQGYFLKSVLKFKKTCGREKKAFHFLLNNKKNLLVSWVSEL